MSKSITPLTLRLPESLKDKLEINAARNDRSINKELAARLRNSFEFDLNVLDIQRLNKELPTARNDCTLGIRLPEKLKETCQFIAETNKTSLNQEILIRLQASFDLLIEYAQFKPNKSPNTIPIEDAEFIKLLNGLNDKNKKAVMNLIKNLS